MFGRNKEKANKSSRPGKIDTLIGNKTVIQGDVKFEGGLHIDGTIKGCVYAEPDSGSYLSLSEKGRIEGDVKVPNIIMNGTVVGDVYAFQRIELAPNARVTGDVYYNLIEMAMGSEVNGNLVHKVDLKKPQNIEKLAKPAAAGNLPAGQTDKSASSVLDRVSQK